jgi:menaquinone-9 beta-reductase
MPPVWDTVVIGAGPAGAAAAIRLASEGTSVLLLDRYSFPRDKVCGDALIPDALNALRRLRLEDRVGQAGSRFRSSRVFSPSRLDFEFNGSFVCIPRLELDELLVNEAIARGAVFRTARVRWIETGAQGVRVHLDGSSEPIEARTVVLATGADISLINQLNSRVRSGPSAVAMRGYVESELEIDQLLISFDRCVLPGYAWIFPLGNGRYNVGCGAYYPRLADANSLRAILTSFVEAFPAARELLQKGRWLSDVRGARLRCGLAGAPPLPAPRVLAVGETIGTTYQFTGEGIGKALETGELAAEVIIDFLPSESLERLSRYASRLEEELEPRYVGYEVAQRWLGHAWLADLLAWRIRSSRSLRSTVESIVAEVADPRAVFSLRGLASSLAR